MRQASTTNPKAGDNMTLPGRSRKITVEPVEVPSPVRVPQPDPEPLPSSPEPPAVDPTEPVPEREPEKVPA